MNTKCSVVPKWVQFWMPLAAIAVGVAANAATNEIPNRLIDYGTFMGKVAEVGALRAQHRLTEEQFIAVAAEPGTIVYDARSRDKYAMLHVYGAKNLAFSDITEGELAKLFPSKATRILIYCNNNFLNEQRAFASKVAPASLNIHTFNTLYHYGYTNVYELGPLIDVQKTKLGLEGTLAK